MNDIRKTLQQSKNALKQYLELWYNSSKFILKGDWNIKHEHFRESKRSGRTGNHNT